MNFLFFLPQKWCMLIACLILFFSCKKSLSGETGDISTVKAKIETTSVERHPQGLQTNMRIYGYMSVSGNQYVKYMDSVNLTQLTDICISFINPDLNGIFTISTDIANAVTKAHNAGVNVHFAIGGGGGPTYWDNLIKPAYRASVISNMRKVATTYDFDGVDVDLEGARITADYNDFVIQLSDTLRLFNKKLSAALSSYQRNLLSATVYSRLDYLNAMVYDYKGTTPASHSSFAQFQTDYTNFLAKIPATKINMGVPGYAWEYNGNTPTTQVSYKNIIKQFPGAYALNYKYPTATTSWWYDGHPVLRQKVSYCLQQGVGGMMMWQIMHDPQDNVTSLLKLMNYCAANPGQSGFDPLLSYTFKAKHSGLFMEVANADLADLAGIQQNTWGNGNHQKWILSETNNEFKITNKNSTKVLDELDETPSGLGLQFVQKTWHGGGNQRFKLVPNALGYYKVVNVASNRLAAVYQSSLSPNIKVVQATDSNADNQQWIISKQ